MNYPELEIGLHRRDAGMFAGQIRYRDPEQESELRVDAYPVRFDMDRLRENLLDPKAYGLALGECLLEHPEIRSSIDKARAVAEASSRPLRLKLGIDRWSLELHALRWETLRDPATGRSLLTDEKILFSRFLGSFDMRPVQLRSKRDLRVLVVVANPSDLSARKPGGRVLAPVDVAGELQRARDAFSGVAVTELAGETRATLDTILKRLREDFDVFYLVCHGALVDQEPRLWLENADGTSQITSGVEFIDGLSRLVKLPRLMVLASCQSAGTGDEMRSDDEGVLAALGPRLAEAGVPAVVAMQGNVLQKTIARFMPVFFTELRKDGQIDRAMAEARYVVREQADDWSPCLYTRLVAGRLWYEQKFSRRDSEFEIWEGLIDQVREGTLIPILGSGLLESYVGTPAEFARRWGEKRECPTASGRWDQHQVAQYLSTTQGKGFAINDFVREATEQLLRHWPALQADADASSNEAAPLKLMRLLSAARELRLRKDGVEPFQILASLDCPLYMSIGMGNLLTDALEAAGKKPRIELSQWRDDNRRAEETSSSAPPTVTEPLVAQLYGNLHNKRSVVLTEDDFFSYLIGMTEMQSRPRPSFIQERLSDAGLMFLGFRIDEWEFRVFVHLLQSLQGGKLRGFYKNVAVQVDPEDGRGGDVNRVRRYLEKYFATPAMQIEIFWGSSEDFLLEMNRRWKGQA